MVTPPRRGEPRDGMDMSRYSASVWPLLLLLLGVWGWSGGKLVAGEREGAAAGAEPATNWNLLARTLGGKQFWTDELVHGSWRIQRNVLSDHYRLLDPNNTRRAWGSWEHCHREWQALRAGADIPPLKPRVVLVLHGLGRTRSSMAQLAEYLAQHGDYDVLSVSYASTRIPLSEDARSLARVISHLEGVTEINFVAHSMGNLVIRHLLHDQLAAAHGRGIDPRIHRFVMLAPPNNGAALARRFRYDPLFCAVYGTGGQQFTRQWEQVQERLAIPPCPFGIIAGGDNDPEGGNPLLDGNDDMVVTVAETQLPGAADFVIVPVLHTFIMDDAQVQEYTLRFLQHGYFIAPEVRRPLANEPLKPDDDTP